ncbi:MAG: hypothetical protein AAF404_08015, partial [Pseudomonadota bacterium]
MEVFEKGAGFDPGDPYVRNIARHTRSTLKKYYESSGRYDDIRIDVPAGNYIATFESRGTAAQAFAVNDAADITVGEKPVLNVAPLAVDRRTDDAMPTVAVIPFDYHGLASDEEYVIGDLLAEHTIAGMSRSPHLNVISKLSTRKLRGVCLSLEEISTRLGCHYVMSGSYRCKNARLTLVVELAECDSGEVIWADEMFAPVVELVQEKDSIVCELLSQTSRSIMVHEIKRASTQPLESLALHTQLLFGQRNMHNDSDKFFLQAKNLLEGVLRAHPDHPAINAHIAQWHVMKINRGGGWDSLIEKDKKEACRYLQRALDSNPIHPLALTINGLVETQFNRDPEKGLEIYNEVQRYHPNEPLLYCYKAAVLSYKGEGHAAIECANKALKLSPYDPQLNLFHT